MTLTVIIPTYNRLECVAAALARLGALAAGTATGLAAGLRLWICDRGSPIRRGREAEQLRERLKGEG